MSKLGLRKEWSMKEAIESANDCILDRLAAEELEGDELLSLLQKIDCFWSSFHWDEEKKVFVQNAPPESDKEEEKEEGEFKELFDAVGCLTKILREKQDQILENPQAIAAIKSVQSAHIELYKAIVEKEEDAEIDPDFPHIEAEIYDTHCTHEVDVVVKFKGKRYQADALYNEYDGVIEEINWADETPPDEIMAVIEEAIEGAS